jgi:hypothetical protein
MKIVCRIILRGVGAPKCDIRVLFALLAILAIWPHYSGRGALAASMQAQNDPSELIIKTETAWEDANLHRDKDALKRLLAPEFVQINEDGTVIPRDEALERLILSRSRPKESKVERRVIKVIGDTAILTAVYTEIGQSPKGFYRVVLNIADVFRYSGGAWKGSVGYGHIVELKSGEPEPSKL